MAAIGTHHGVGREAARVGALFISLFILGMFPMWATGQATEYVAPPNFEIKSEKLESFSAYSDKARDCCLWERACVASANNDECSLRELLKCLRQRGRQNRTSRLCNKCLLCRDNKATLNRETLVVADDPPVEEVDRCIPQTLPESAGLLDTVVYIFCRRVQYICKARRDSYGECPIGDYELNNMGRAGHLGRWCLMC